MALTRSVFRPGRHEREANVADDITEDSPASTVDTEKVSQRKAATVGQCVGISTLTVGSDLNQTFVFLRLL